MLSSGYITVYDISAAIHIGMYVDLDVAHHQECITTHFSISGQVAAKHDDQTVDR
ncbi:MAG TPA: hypothetical protein VI524_07670 [Anaerolineales bacterium]|nr:hypothetical protein [Anaerolineales bacterium]